MKIKINKWIGLITAFALVLMSLNSCVKNRNELGTDFSQLQDHVLMINGGLLGVSSSNVAFPTDTTTITITVNLASVNLPTTPTKVTIAYDPKQIMSFNAANGKNYQAFDPSGYKIASTTLTIPAGQQYASTTITFYKAAADPAVSYLIPISITDASGKALSSNQNTRFFNIIGNPLSGNYLQSYYRYNGTNDTTSVPGTTGVNVPVVIGPVDGSTLLLPEYYLEAVFGAGVNLAFDNNNGVFDNFSVFLDDATKKTLADNNFKLVVLKLVSATVVGDNSTKYAGTTFRTYMEIINSSGRLRTIVDNFVKQ